MCVLGSRTLNEYDDDDDDIQKKIYIKILLIIIALLIEKKSKIKSMNNICIILWKLIPEQFTVKAHLALFEGKGKKVRNTLIPVYIHIQNLKTKL